MGRVLTEATIENLDDLWAVRSGRLPSEKVRRITVQDALSIPEPRRWRCRRASFSNLV